MMSPPFSKWAYRVVLVAAWFVLLPSPVRSASGTVKRVCDNSGYHCGDMSLQDEHASGYFDLEGGGQHPAAASSGDWEPVKLGFPRLPESFWDSIKLDNKKEKRGEPIKETKHVLLIDAGSGGSRMHLYEYYDRVFTTIPPPLTNVSTDSRWTSRLKPGLSTFYSYSTDELPEKIGNYLQPLFDFAMKVLKDKEDSWSEYHVYLKATGGMRTLSVKDRRRIIGVVRGLFRNEHPQHFHNPFKFASIMQARVISGEEEAIFSWTSINYLMGTLVKYSYGSGTVVNPNITFGALDMGGASTQISF